MTKSTALFMASLLIAGGCASMSRVRLDEVKPNRVYHRPFSDVFEAVRLYCFREGFTLDRYGEEAGRVIGHRNTPSSAVTRHMSSIGETATMVVITLKIRGMATGDTEVLANFSFENGHVVVSREEESILLDYYSSFFDYMQENAGS